MNPQEQAHYNQKSSVNNDLSVMQPGEQVLFKLKRHPIGLVAIYIMTAFLLAIIAVLALAVVPNMLEGDMRSQAMRYGGIIFLVTAIIGVLYNLLATKIYWGNSWVVTSDSLTQVTQTSLFDRESSQLSLHSLEDVSAVQNGILTHAFNYGLLKVETAGEHSKFQFLYCPNPNYYAREILAARESFMMAGESSSPPAPTNPQPDYAQSHNQSDPNP